MAKPITQFSGMLRRIGMALILAAAGMPLAHAQSNYPAKPIRIVVPYSPGGGVDIVTRLVGQKMAEHLKQTVIVENRPGAGTNIGMSAVAKAEPDGYTLLTASNTLASNGALYKNLDFDPGRDLIPVGSIGYAPLVVVVPQNAPFKTLQEMIAFGRANPDKLTYGSAGNGSSGHLGSELLKAEARFDALHIPYKGGSPAVTDLLGGRLSFMSINPLEVIPHIQADKLRALAILDKKPFPLLPNVQPISTLGFPNSTATVWWGLVGPKGMPKDVVAKLNGALRQALADPAVIKRLGEFGATVTPGSDAEFGTFLGAETAKWSKLIKAAGIQAD